MKKAPVGAPLVFDDQGLANTNVSNLVLPGIYIFTLRAFDDIHMTTRDVTLTVNPAKRAVIAYLLFQCRQLSFSDQAARVA